MLTPSTATDAAFSVSFQSREGKTVHTCSHDHSASPVMNTHCFLHCTQVTILLDRLTMART